MNNENKKIIVGIGVLVYKDGKVLLGKRAGKKHGAGEYAGPGGKMDYMESIADCAKREVLEETGMEIDNIRFLRLLNFKDHPPEQYIDIAVTADWKSGELKNLEPEKCEGWDWYDTNKPPKPLFKSLPSCFEALKTGKNFFDN